MRQLHNIMPPNGCVSGLLFEALLPRKLARWDECGWRDACCNGDGDSARCFFTRLPKKFARHRM